MLLPAAQNGRRCYGLFGLDASPLHNRRDELVVLDALLRRDQMEQLQEFFEPDVLSFARALGPDLRGNQMSGCDRVGSTAWRFCAIDATLSPRPRRLDGVEVLRHRRDVIDGVEVHEGHGRRTMSIMGTGKVFFEMTPLVSRQNLAKIVFVMCSNL